MLNQQDFMKVQALTLLCSYEILQFFTVNKEKAEK